mgnify:FL=1
MSNSENIGLRNNKNSMVNDKWMEIHQGKVLYGYKMKIMDGAENRSRSKKNLLLPIVTGS